MFYVKERINDAMEVSIEINDENVYTTCPGCGIEHRIDIVEMAQCGDFDLFGTAIYCCECSEKMNKSR